MLVWAVPAGSALGVVSMRTEERRDRWCRITSATTCELVERWEMGVFRFESHRRLQVWKIPAQALSSAGYEQGGFASIEAPDGNISITPNITTKPGIWRVPVAGARTPIYPGARPSIGLVDAGREWPAVRGAG